MIQYEKYIQYEEKMYYLEHAHEGFMCIHDKFLSAVCSK